MQQGKSVVTSNKELVAEKGAELLTLAKERNVNFFFEASVGGGIPIIRPMHLCLAANRIDEVYGILNGTTNFILTKMIKEHMTFQEALALAQQLGYAEKILLPMLMVWMPAVRFVFWHHWHLENMFILRKCIPKAFQPLR